MNLFIYEHLTSGANAAEALPQSLLSEGDSMVQAVIRDLATTDDYQLITLRDQTLADSAADHCKILWVSDQASYKQAWQQCLEAADAVLLIAPESDGILAHLQRAVITNGKVELGCTPAVTQLCGDKLALSGALNKHGFQTLPCQTLADYHHQPLFHAQQLVIKPRDGAGSIDIFLLDASTDLTHWLKDSPSSWLVQPYLEGPAISLNGFFSDNTSTLLSRNHQQLRFQQHRLEVTASIPAADGEAVISEQAACQLLADLKHALPGLWGFVGIDLINTAEGPVVVEINPRVTSSYPAISSITGLNPCRLLSQLLHEKFNQGT